MDGIVLKRGCDGEVRNVSLLAAIGVNNEVYREGWRDALKPAFYFISASGGEENK